MTLPCFLFIKGREGDSYLGEMAKFEGTQRVKSMALLGDPAVEFPMAKGIKIILRRKRGTLFAARASGSN
jgi:hypothetical protein